MTEVSIEKIIRSKRKTLGLEVTRDAQLIIRAPEKISLGAIKRIVFKKQVWIKNKQVEVRKRHKHTEPKEFVSGEGFLYLGDTYKLEFVDSVKEPIIFDKSFKISRKYLNHAKKILIDWYKARAIEKITERVKWYAYLSGIQYNIIKITNAKKRWGSCGAKGSLNFSWRLIMAPLKALDYVVIHEISHLAERNHSRNFWNKIKILMPDYEKYKYWLKENEHLLII
ncbi:MAG: M48 family metallopeptidase [Candidatus Omnitrophica bacterium]|nr:M48 family metallopeptidase [Candidatus Omnitrophota bacterium]